MTTLRWCAAIDSRAPIPLDVRSVRGGARRPLWDGVRRALGPLLDPGGAMTEHDGLSGIHALKAELAKADANNDGTLDLEELQTLMDASGGEDGLLYKKLGLGSADEVLRRFDENGDGVLDERERAAMLRALIPVLQAERKEMSKKGVLTRAGVLTKHINEITREHNELDLAHAKAQGKEFEDILHRGQEQDRRAFKEAWDAKVAEVEEEFAQRERALLSGFEAERFKATVAIRKLEDDVRTGAKTMNPSKQMLSLRQGLKQLIVNLDYFNAEILQKKVTALQAEERKKFVAEVEGRIQKRLAQVDAKEKTMKQSLAAKRLKALQKVNDLRAAARERLNTHHRAQFQTHSHRQTMNINLKLRQFDMPPAGVQLTSGKETERPSTIGYQTITALGRTGGVFPEQEQASAARKGGAALVVEIGKAKKGAARSLGASERSTMPALNMSMRGAGGAASTMNRTSRKLLETIKRTELISSPFFPVSSRPPSQAGLA